MILFTLLVVILTIFAAVILSVLGASGILLLVVFGDLMICIGIIYLIVKLFNRKK